MLVRTPGFFKTQMTNDVFVRHYTAVADASPVPVLLYNFTAVTGVNLLPAAVARLATHPNIVGMKESGGDIAQIADLVSLDAGRLQRARRLGGDASIRRCASAPPAASSRSPNVLPDACVRLFELAQSGPARRGASRCSASWCRWRGCSARAYGVPGLKAALKLLGYDVGVPRPPLAAAARRGRRRAARRARAVRGNPRMSLLPDIDRILLGPGPSLTAPRVMRAMAAPTLSHLDPLMLALLDDVRARLARMFRARRRVVRVRGVRHRHVGHGNGRRQPGPARARARSSSSPATSAIASRRCASATARRSRGSTSSGAGPAIPRRCGAQLKATPADVVAMVHAETSTGVLNPVQRARGDRARARRADDRRRGHLVRRPSARRRRAGASTPATAARRSVSARRRASRRSCSDRARSRSA